MRKWIAGLLTTTALGGGLYGADQKINPYTDKGTHYELPIKADIEQGERVEIAKDKAAMTLKGWNDEYAITITPQIPTPTFGADEAIDRPFVTEADRPLLSKKMEFREGDVTAFIEPKEGTENQFDIDFILYAKPDTNVFTYKIEGADDFDFYYQPELTPQEIADGASRPENVVGSYAVYHKTKANHQVGDTNYATGKAFHILRPKAIDANGTEALAELSYTGGALSVLVPQKFLDDAVYPVTVDPTFGYTSIGGTAGGAHAGNTVRVTQYSAPEAGTVNDITVYTQANAGGSNVRGVFYKDSDNSVVDTGVETTLNTTAAWKTFDMNDAAITAQTYKIGIWFNSVTINLWYDTDAAYALRRDNETYASTGNPTSFTEASNIASRRYSMYATYTASAAAASFSPWQMDDF